jgi:hypothetical protein
VLEGSWHALIDGLIVRSDSGGKGRFILQSVLLRRACRLDTDLTVTWDATPRPWRLLHHSVILPCRELLIHVEICLLIPI